MFFKTYCEALEILDQFGLKETDLRPSAIEATGEIIRDIAEIDGKLHTSLPAARYWAKRIVGDRHCLLLVTEYGIWPSRENQHLFYKLRAAYNEEREIHVAPGHYFLQHEHADLVTFLDLVMQFGWGRI